MSNPLEPGNRRNNWLEKEESDTSQFLEIMQAMIDDAKRQIEVLRQNYQATVAGNKTRILFEYMLNQKDPAEFFDKDLLRELKEAPVMLLNPDDSRSFHGAIEYPEDFIPDSDDPDWEGHYYPEDPVEFGHFDAENETFSDYLKRMGQ
jgi:hypothetical protein